MRVAEEYASQYTDHYLITADEQTNGRGRKGNDWKSPNGGLWLTLGMHHISTQKTFTLYIGYCVLKVLNEIFYPAEFQIKWPNDIYLKNHKVCGLICSQYPQYHKTLVGIGLNTNQDTDEYQTIKSILKKEIPNKTYQDTILNQIFSHLTNYEKEGISLFRAYYEKYDFLKNKYLNIKIGERQLSGQYAGICDDGGLVLDTTEEKQETVYAGTVELG